MNTEAYAACAATIKCQNRRTWYLRPLVTTVHVNHVKAFTDLMWTETTKAKNFKASHNWPTWSNLILLIARLLLHIIEKA